MTLRDDDFLRRINHDDDEERERAARELFWFHWPWLEPTLQRRLEQYGIANEPDSNDFCDLIDYVIERTYAAEALLRAVRDFDSNLGTLTNWIRNRVLYALRDWLKKRPKGEPGTLVIDNADVPADPDAPNGSQRDQSSALEAALEKMTSQQRACAVLRLHPARELTGRDLEVICEVAGCDVHDIGEQLAGITPNIDEKSIGPREQELVGELSSLSALCQFHDRVQQSLRRQLLELGEPEAGLIDLEKSRKGETQESIRKRFETTESADALHTESPNPPHEVQVGPS